MSATIDELRGERVKSYDHAVAPTVQSLAFFGLWSLLLVVLVVVSLASAVRRDALSRALVTVLGIGCLGVWAICAYELIPTVTVTGSHGTVITCQRSALAESGLFGARLTDFGSCHDAGVHRSLILLGLPTIVVIVSCVVLIFAPSRIRGSHVAAA